MRGRRKIWALIALVLIIFGLGFGFVGFVMAGFNPDKLNTDGKGVTNEHEINDDFTKIEIDTSTSDIRFETAADGKVKVVCKESEKRFHDVSVQNGTLVIKEKSEKKWFEYIGFFNSRSAETEIVVYLPEKSADISRKIKKDTKFDLEGLMIDTSTGDVKLNDLHVKGELKINTSTGELMLSNVAAGSMIIETSTGEVTMNETEIREELKIETSTGDVKLTSCDADTVRIDTSTGDVTCEFLSEKNIRTDTSTGSVTLPAVTDKGGSCVVDTSTGDIRISYAQ